MKHLCQWRQWLVVVVTSAVLLGSVGGCRLTRDDKGLFVDPRDDYLNAQVGTPLVVPDGMADANIKDALPIPEIVEQPITKLFPRKAPRPAVLVGRDFDAVRIQRLGKRQWIVLGDPPAQIWPLTKQFLADNGIGVGQEDVAAGVIDSAWIVVIDQDYDDSVRSAIRAGRARHVEQTGEAVPPGRDRLRFRVERGIRRGSTEVHVVHQSTVGVGDDLAAAIVPIQAEVTTQLAEYYAAGVAASVSMVGLDIATADKARIVKDDKGYPALHLRVDYDRAWATVSQALRRAEISAEADAENAVYHAVFPATGTATWLKRIVPGGESGRDIPVRIHVARDSLDTVISVSAPDGKPLTVELAEEVLVTLREFAV